VPNDPCIRYIRLSGQRSLGAKRNECVEACRGDLIMHWDDDDWMAPHRISYQVDALLREDAGRGAAFGDLDNDGDIDVVLSNVGQKAIVLRNDGGNRNNWLTIRTVGTTSNRDGIGCLVKVVSASGLSQSFTVNTAVGYLSASDKRLLVGLGSDATAKLVEIRWPSGIVQRFENVAARQTLTAKEPAR